MSEEFPVLSGHKTLYVGSRYLAFVVDHEHPFDIWEGDWYSADDDECFVVWDSLYRAIVACGTRSKTGVFSGFLPSTPFEWPNDEANTIEQFIEYMALEVSAMIGDGHER